MLQDDTAASANPGYTPAQATGLLYAGEMFDTDAQMYYNRARYYDPLNGRFNRMDPFAGNNSDPQSLHKYLYCHNNPINNIDPFGLFTIPRTVVALGIGAVIGAIAGSFAGKALGIGGARGAYLGLIFGGALGYGVASGKFLTVLVSAFLDGLVNLVVEFFVYDYVEKILSVSGSDYSHIDTARLADAFLTGLAYGAAAAAVSIKMAKTKMNEYMGALAAGGAAAVLSVLRELLDSLVNWQKPNLIKIFANAAVAFVLAVATQPQLLFKMGIGKGISEDALNRSALRIVNNIEKIKYGLGKLVELIAGGAVSFGIRSVENSYAADLRDIY